MRVDPVPVRTRYKPVVAALNAVGTSPRDLIAVLEAIKSAGALHADLIIQ